MIGSNPVQVFQMFDQGLIYCIYTNQELKELLYFPETFQKTVLRTLVDSGQKNGLIQLKITSSIPDWFEGRKHYPYHVIQLRVIQKVSENIIIMTLIRRRFLPQIVSVLGRSESEPSRKSQTGYKI